MLTSRLQVLLEPSQRAALDRESRRTGQPVGQLVREAIEARFASARDAKLEAIAQMREHAPEGEALEPDRIDELIRAEHDR